MDPNWAISFVRTVVAPFIVGAFGQLLLLAGVDDPDPTLRAAVASIVAAVWYVLARLLSIWNPQLGFLLIVAAQPHYTEEGSPVAENELLVSVIRTVVPLAVGCAVGWAIRVGFDLDEQQLVLLFQGLVTGGYYGILRWIEEKALPDSKTRDVTGVMLGARAVPHY